MVQGDVTFSERLEEIGRGVEDRPGRGQIGRVLEIGPVQLQPGQQIGRTEGAVDRVDVAGVELEVREQKLSHGLGTELLELEAEGGAGTPEPTGFRAAAKEIAGVVIPERDVGMHG